MAQPKKAFSVPKETMTTQMAFAAHRRQQMGFGWHRVDPALMYAAIACCIDSGYALMLSGASGGRGVCIKILKGRNAEPETEYANNAEELHKWLEAIVDTYGGGAEDEVEVIRSGMMAQAVSPLKLPAAMSRRKPTTAPEA